jgi:hypothetical protein
MKNSKPYYLAVIKPTSGDRYHWWIDLEEQDTFHHKIDYGEAYNVAEAEQLVYEAIEKSKSWRKREAARAAEIEAKTKRFRVEA